MSKKKAFGWYGSVSTCTMRSEDLVPAFMDCLMDLDIGTATMIEKEYPEMFGDDPDYGSDDADELLEALFDALDACAPEGHYFGAHPGDGSDYGFWEIEA